MGALSIDLLLKGNSGVMIGSKGDELITTSLIDATKLHNSPNLEDMKLIHSLLTRNN
jgi:hypothetical protein